MIHTDPYIRSTALQKIGQLTYSRSLRPNVHYTVYNVHFWHSELRNILTWGCSIPLLSELTPLFSLTSALRHQEIPQQYQEGIFLIPIQFPQLDAKANSILYVFSFPKSTAPRPEESSRKYQGEHNFSNKSSHLQACQSQTDEFSIIFYMKIGWFVCTRQHPKENQKYHKDWNWKNGQME